MTTDKIRPRSAAQPSTLRAMLAAPLLPDAVVLVAMDLMNLGAMGHPVHRDDAPLASAANDFANTQLFEADGQMTMVVVSGDFRADPVNLSGVLGVMDVIEVSEKVAAQRTGQHPNALAPFGHRLSMSVVIDVDLSQHRRVWLPAGDPHYVFASTYSELLRITAGMAAEVGELPRTDPATTMQG